MICADFLVIIVMAKWQVVNEKRTAENIKAFSYSHCMAFVEVPDDFVRCCVSEFKLQHFQSIEDDLLLKHRLIC